MLYGSACRGHVAARFVRNLKKKKKQERKRTSMSRVVSRYICSRKKPSTCSFHRTIFRGMFFFHIHKEGIRVVSGTYSRAHLPRDPYPRWPRNLINHFVSDHCATISRDTWCNRVWKHENCVLFSGIERHIVSFLNLGKQSVSLWHQV